MTLYNKTALKTFFEQGDVPQGTDYANLIDSQVNIAETGEQDMAGSLSTTKLITPLVSAAKINTSNLTTTSANITGGLISNVSMQGSVIRSTTIGDILPSSGNFTIVSADAINASAGRFSGGVIASANSGAYAFRGDVGGNATLSPVIFDARAGQFVGGTTLTGFQFANVSLAASAAVSTITGFNIQAPSFGTAASASTMNGINIANLGTNARMVSSTALLIAFQAGSTSTNQCINCASGTFIVDGLGAVLNGVAITSAAGTAIGTAAPVSYNNIVRGQGVTDGSATGFGLLANKKGLVQQFVYEGATSANLWPAGADYQINTLASGTPFPLAANTTYTVIYKTASAYAVK